MKQQISPTTQGFTIAEMLIATAIASVILALILTSSVALQKSYNEVDNYASTHVQQVRIIDYLSRDVRRGLSVTSDIDKQSVTIAIPKYIYQAGDSDLPDASKIDTPRPPNRVRGNFAGVRTSGEINYNEANNTAKLPYNRVVYSVQGSSIVRTQDNVLTTIASSTDNLIPETTDTELANTEYATTKVTFEPISIADRGGTAVYSTAYLRNMRRTPPASPTPTGR